MEGPIGWRGDAKAGAESGQKQISPPSNGVEDCVQSTGDHLEKNQCIASTELVGSVQLLRYASEA